MTIPIVESETCPICGSVVRGDPWDLKKHLRHRHARRTKDFTSHFNAIVRRWMKK